MSVLDAAPRPPRRCWQADKPTEHALYRAGRQASPPPHEPPASDAEWPVVTRGRESKWRSGRGCDGCYHLPSLHPPPPGEDVCAKRPRTSAIITTPARASCCAPLLSSPPSPLRAIARCCCRHLESVSAFVVRFFLACLTPLPTASLFQRALVFSLHSPVAHGRKHEGTGVGCRRGGRGARRRR